jgi:hypothetical protein
MTTGALQTKRHLYPDERHLADFSMGKRNQLGVEKSEVEIQPKCRASQIVYLHSIEPDSGDLSFAAKPRFGSLRQDMEWRLVPHR